jgi:membrane peptidoglycan carboxypeptidase
LNLRPPLPQSGALTKLRYIPMPAAFRANGPTLAHPAPFPVTRTAIPPRGSVTTPSAPPAGITRPAPLASILMRNTRPLPQQPAPGPPGPPAPRARPGQRGTSRGRRFLKRTAAGLGTLAGLLAVGAGVLWVVTPPASQATQLARALAEKHGIPYPGPSVPAAFARPLIATEDHRFYGEPGVDLLAVARVVQARVTGGGDQGGATIEQQLAKMLYTPAEAGLTAEVKQVALAVKLNIAYSKQQILDMYAEAAYYGHGFYGLERASCGYFGHPARDLTVVQGAMLAGVVNAPGADDPISDPANARARLQHVIARMVAVGYLSSVQGQRALKAPLGLGRGNGPGC